MLTFDFNSIKNRLNEKFKEKYGIENSNLIFSVKEHIFDILAEEINRLALYDEYLTQETKWQLARNRRSILSQTQFFNYHPHRKKSSTGVLKVSDTLNDGNLDPISNQKIVLPPGIRFTNGETEFVTIEKQELSQGEIPEISVTQGIIQEKEIIVPTGNTDFYQVSIEDPSIEDSFLEVFVNNILWGKTSFLHEADTINSSKIYIVENKTDFSGIDITFGNNFLGQKVNTGDIIKIRYIETKGSEGNIYQTNSIVICLDKIPITINNINIETDLFCTNENVLIGGTDYESIDSIRDKAPKTYLLSNRIITRSDYKTAVEYNSKIVSAIVWGAEEHNTDLGLPKDTYIATAENTVKISTFTYDENTNRASTITPAIEQEIRENINLNKSPTELVEFIDPQFVYAIFNSKIYVDDTQLNKITFSDVIKNQIKEKYRIDKNEFSQSLYFSNYYEYIEMLSNVHYHTTTTSYIIYLNDIKLSDGVIFDINVEFLESESIKIETKKSGDNSYSTLYTSKKDSNNENRNLLEINTSSFLEKISPDNNLFISLQNGHVLKNDFLDANKIMFQEKNTNDANINCDFIITFSTQNLMGLRLLKRNQIYGYHEDSIVTVEYT